ncbi:DUF2332 domain-containing protein [Streptomyces luteireticuli]|uniref:DUF2332 domain-containing protein n=1 Tax=Streptomyces luteireticuli TaxID=173858 RepID=UPI0035566E14
MTRARTADLIDTQARACAELGSPLYAALLARAAEDVRAGGPCADAVAPLAGAPGPAAVALRLLGAVHALVLLGKAPELAEHYARAGDPEAAWEPFRRAVAEHPDHIATWMRRPPQTNEVGRAGQLIAGLLTVLDDLGLPEPPPVRLLELGASAGLNLRADRFRIRSGGDGREFAWGDPASPVVLDGAWRDGAPPPRIAAAAARVPGVTVVERLGCDVDPLDPLDPAEALALRAYLWPDVPHRAERLAGALALAREVPARVVRQGAADFLAGTALRPGTLTVVWHSVMRQYVPPAEWSRAEAELGRLARAGRGPDTGWFAHLAFEPRRVGGVHRFVLTARLGDGPQEVLAEAHPWGLDARATEATALDG